MIHNKSRIVAQNRINDNGMLHRNCLIVTLNFDAKVLINIIEIGFQYLPLDSTVVFIVNKFNMDLFDAI